MAIIAVGITAHRSQQDAGAARAALAAVEPSSPSEIAVGVSMRLFPEGGAAEIVLISDRPSGDALAAGSLIGLFDTTFLIAGSEELPPVTAAELARLGNPRVHILGGSEAISTAIDDELLAAGHDIHRHYGPTQADTAVDIASAHFQEAATAVLVRIPDLTAGPVEAISSALAATAMAAANDLPILLTRGDGLSSSTAAFLETSPLSDVIVIGNEEQIGAAVTARLDELGVAWQRVGGVDRFDHAVGIASHRGFASLQDAEVAVLVEGADDSVWPTGLLASVLAAQENGPVLLTQGDELPSPTAAYLATGAGQVELVCVPGVTEQACAAAEEIIGVESATEEPAPAPLPETGAAGSDSGETDQAADEAGVASAAQSDDTPWPLVAVMLLGVIGLAVAVPAVLRLRGRSDGSRLAEGARQVRENLLGSSRPAAHGQMRQMREPSAVEPEPEIGNAPSTTAAAPSGDAAPVASGRRVAAAPTRAPGALPAWADPATAAFVAQDESARSWEELGRRDRALEYARTATADHVRLLRTQVRLLSVCLAIAPLTIVIGRHLVDASYLPSLASSVGGILALSAAVALTGVGVWWLRASGYATPPAWPWRTREHAARRQAEWELMQALEAAAAFAREGLSLHAAVDRAAQEAPFAVARRLEVALTLLTHGEGQLGPGFAEDCARWLHGAAARGQEPELLLTTAAAELSIHQLRSVAQQRRRLPIGALLPAAFCLLPAVILLLA